ncbi:hypothetical protein N8289_02350 [Flavobacteriales bacterium]|nr:hypothetical protein [Flavobacteriales bacterium]MDA9775873.1 hypothetical protein [Flavobacteriales bacterium]MDB9932413.1 hypothetical protein [Flavobacteriales bacterium]MDC1370660.1 hypothetical protein [Flavobacteriales bacterium]MDG1175451.1 hypothetical protein [Flavobacteriales bacterium]
MWKKLIDKLKGLFGVSVKSEMHRNTDIPRDDYSYNEIKADKQKRVDAILDKISQKGLDSLSGKEKEFLDKESGNI